MMQIKSYMPTETDGENILKLYSIGLEIFNLFIIKFTYSILLCI